MNRLYKDISRIRNVHTCCALSKEVPHNLKNKKYSSQLWLKRQLRDPYVELAKQEKYRCRSAFKLLQLNERYKILRPGLTIVDCGAAPGSWTQVAVNISNARQASDDFPVGKVYAVDRLPFYPVEGATVLGNMDFTNAETQETLLKLLQGNKVDVVLSDMAPNATGVRELDHENIILLAYAVTRFALRISKVEGALVIKVWDGGKSCQLERDLSKFYRSVKVFKPEATRDESTEKFILARGFRGIKTR